VGSLNSGLRPFPATIYADPLKALEAAISEFTAASSHQTLALKLKQTIPQAGIAVRNLMNSQKVVTPVKTGVQRDFNLLILLDTDCSLSRP